MSLVNAVCGMFGAPWQCVATVRSVSHVSALTVMSTTHTPGDKPYIVEVKGILALFFKSTIIRLYVSRYTNHYSTFNNQNCINYFYFIFRATSDWSFSVYISGYICFGIWMASIRAYGCSIWSFSVHGHISPWWYSILGTLHFTAKTYETSSTSSVCVESE